MPSTNSLTDYAEDLVINALLRNVSFTPPTTVYVGLFTSNPTDTGLVGVEVSGGAYVRVAVTFGAPITPGIVSNSAAVIFPRATTSWGTVTHVAIFDALTGGNMLFGGAADVSQSIVVGTEIRFDIGGLVCSVS